MGNEKSRIIEARLPEVLIQHIQSFLNGKKAAQTSVLSESWYSAWSTRPNLDFDKRHFRYTEGFWEFAKKTMQRYEALNLRIQSFRLVVLVLLSSDFCHAKELIVKAMRMGAVDFDFQLTDSIQTFTLPHEVLGSETLIKLSVCGCKIDIRSDGKEWCGKLKYLCLKGIKLEDNVICGLISSCPLIEKLTLDSINHQFELGSRNLYEMYKLKSLFLDNVNVDTLFFSNLTANFPCLKDLTIEDCDGYNRQIQLSSRSLECISFTRSKGVLRVNFDVLVYDYSGTAWFLKLKNLLSRLSLSKISLTLHIYSIKENCPKYQSLPEIAVENVVIHVVSPSSYFTVFEYLFWICCPKFITLHFGLNRGLSSREGENDFVASLLERNGERVRKRCLMMNHELEKVDVEFFEESVAERWPLTNKINFRLGWRGQV